MTTEQMKPTHISNPIIIPENLWEDNGSLGLGFLHAPAWRRVACIKRHAPRRFYVTVIGSDKHPHGQIVESESLDELADRLHAEGLIVTTTHSGGTYYRLRPRHVGPEELLPHRLDGRPVRRSGRGDRP